MSFYHFSPSPARSFSSILRSCQNVEGLPLSEVLSEHDIQKAFEDADCHFAENDDNVFTPAVTLWAFLSDDATRRFDVDDWGYPQLLRLFCFCK